MLIRASWVRKQNAGNERMIEISTAIKEGALASSMQNTVYF